MKSILIACLVFVAVFAEDANDKDVAKWKGQGEQNAKEDLDKWPSVAASNDKAPKKEQLQKLDDQVKEAGDNIKKVVPVLSKVVSTIHSLGGGDSTNWFKGKGLQGVIEILFGKRDNKSYYLLDGSHNWINNRTEALKGKDDDLAKQLHELDTKVVTVRDLLDNVAGNFVKSLTKLHDLVKDTKGNQEEIKKVSNEMYDNFKKSDELLKQNQELMDQAEHLAVSY